MEHKTSIQGFDNMEDLAKSVGDLRYDVLQEFLFALSKKLFDDSVADTNRGRENLGSALMLASFGAKSASAHIEEAWKHSKPYMEVKETILTTKEEFKEEFNEEFKALTNEEYEDQLKRLIRNYEERVAYYKKALEDYHKDKLSVVDTDSWLKNLYREEKNENEKYLKEYREELTYFRQGLNPPFMYKRLGKYIAHDEHTAI